MPARSTPTSSSGGPTLFACAVHAEAAAVAKALGHTDALPDDLWRPIQLRDGLAVMITGVGKANAAAAVATALARSPHAAIISAGVAGALPGSRLTVGDTLIATACAFADEGIETSSGFTSIADLGFPITHAIEGATRDTLKTTLALPEPLRATARGPIATVSTGSATDARASAVAERTGALAEAMEGAAIALVAARLNVPFAEIRAISNHTGDREKQNWDLPKALSALQTLLSSWP